MKEREEKGGGIFRSESDCFSFNQPESLEDQNQDRGRIISHSEDRPKPGNEANFEDSSKGLASFPGSHAREREH